MKTTSALSFHRTEERLHETEQTRRHQSSCCAISETLPRVEADTNEML